jgi:transposase
MVAKIMADTPELSPVGTPSQLVLAPDPTQNVKDIVQATIETIKDLRATDLANFNALRGADHTLREAMRDADRRLHDSEMKRIDEVSILRANHAAELAQAEAKRIDAIRAVDVNAVAIATERANAQAQVLANQVQSSAETLRSLVATTAQSQKQQYDQTTAQLSDRLTTLEQQQYKGLGSAGQIPPLVQEQLDRQAALISSLKESRDVGSGRQGMSTAVLLSITAIVAALVSVILQRLMTGGF